MANQLSRLGHSEEAEATRQPAPNGEVEADLGQALEIAVRINDEHRATKQQERK